MQKTYNTFLNGEESLSVRCNKALSGFRELKQTTVYLFLFSVFDDYYKGLIDQNELANVLELLLNYTIRRMICEVGSNSLRGLYKSLYSRVFNRPENKEHYHDAIISFLLQLTSKDVMPTNERFSQALVNNNLYKKNALCKYLLTEIENQGKEQIITDSLTIEHIMPQNKNLSKPWRTMLGEDWESIQTKYLHTLGNLTLTGYNSELGDSPFKDKKEMLKESVTHITLLYEDVKDKEEWNEHTIVDRANNLVKLIIVRYPAKQPQVSIDFSDPRYQLFTAADSSLATHKIINYYELLGEKVVIDSFMNMTRSVSEKLYELDEKIIENMARNNTTFPGWRSIVFSYDKDAVRGEYKLKGTDIYMLSGMSAHDNISFIRNLLEQYDLDVSEDFVYSARPNKE